jgi:hypothetical protein
MNRTPDVELVLRDYFADDSSSAPDHVLDVIEERIMRQPQQRAWRVLRRDSRMNSYMKPLLAVAAVVVIAVAGIAFLRPPSGSGTGGAASPAPSPSLAPSASPSTAPSTGAVFPEWFTPDSGSNGAGVLPPGSATTQGFLPGSTFNVPAGWVSTVDTADFYGLFPDTPANKAEFGLSGKTAQSIFMGIVDTPGDLVCDGVGETHGSTSAELVDSLVANEALVTSKPVAVTIGDLTGTRVDAHLDPDWTGRCANNPGGPPTKEDKDYRGRFVFLDIPGGGKLLIIVDSAHAADFEAFVADAMPIVESFQFHLTP